MARRSRRRRWLKWAGTLLTIMLLVVYATSVACLVFWVKHSHDMAFGIAVGDMFIMWHDPTYMEETPRSVISARGNAKWQWWFSQMGSRRSRTGYIIIPLWLPTLICVIPTAILWWKDRRPAKGRCAQCGYDLTGNLSGTCPECGKAVLA